MCALTSQPKWIPVGSLEGSLGITPLLISKKLSSQEGPFDFKDEKYVTSFMFYLGRAHPASSLNCPIDLLEFLSTWNELQLLTSCLQFNQLSSFRLGCLNFSGSFACLQMLVLVLSVILQISFASWLFLFRNVCELGFIDMS